MKNISSTLNTTNTRCLCWCEIQDVSVVFLVSSVALLLARHVEETLVLLPWLHEQILLGTVHLQDLSHCATLLLYCPDAASRHIVFHALLIGPVTTHGKLVVTLKRVLRGAVWTTNYQWLMHAVVLLHWKVDHICDFTLALESHFKYGDKSTCRK